MKLRPGPGFDEFMQLRFKAGTWERRGIPEVGCWMRTTQLEQMLASQAELHPSDVIYGLMDRLDETDEPEPVLATLRRLLDRHFPDDGRKSGRCLFQDEDATLRVFHAVSAIDFTGRGVAWQRQNWVIALAQPSSEAGRMAVGAPGPISLRVAQEVLALSVLKEREKSFDSFQEAIAVSQSSASAFWIESAAAAVYWQHGLEQAQIVAGDWLPPKQLAAMVAIASAHHLS